MDWSLDLIGHSKGCTAIALDEDFLFTGGNDNLIKKWSLLDGQLLSAFKGSMFYFVIHAKAIIFVSPA
jgi:WD40 repeat protein